jgi:hypothetical protein
VALALFCGSTIADKMSFVFDVFDLDGSSTLTGDEIDHLLECSFKCLHMLQLVKQQPKPEHYLKMREAFVEHMDIDLSGDIDREEFTEWVSNRMDVCELVLPYLEESTQVTSHQATPTQSIYTTHDKATGNRKNYERPVVGTWEAAVNGYISDGRARQLTVSNSHNLAPSTVNHVVSLLCQRSNMGFSTLQELMSDFVCIEVSRRLDSTDASEQEKEFHHLITAEEFLEVS